MNQFSKKINTNIFVFFQNFRTFLNPMFSALDARIAQSGPENRIPHANICIMTAGNVGIPDSQGFPKLFLFNWFMGL